MSDYDYFSAEEIYIEEPGLADHELETLTEGRRDGYVTVAYRESSFSITLRMYRDRGVLVTEFLSNTGVIEQFIRLHYLKD
jgi:hypothetical protein